MPYRKQRTRGLGDELALAREIFPDHGVGVPTYRRMVPAISAELRRCRRYEHPMAVLVIAMAAAQTPDVGDADSPITANVDLLTFVVLGSLLRDVTRESDIVTYAAQEHVYALFLPETDEASARRAARRLAAECHGRAAARIRAGVAVFPGHGLTVDALFDVAVGTIVSPVLHDNPTADGRAAWRSARTAR